MLDDRLNGRATTISAAAAAAAAKGKLEKTPKRKRWPWSRRGLELVRAVRAAPTIIKLAAVDQEKFLLHKH